MTAAGEAGRAHIELYGPPTLVADGQRVTPVGRPSQVLALLAIRMRAPVSATDLLDQLWPEAPNSGLNALQRHISTLRRMLRTAGLDDLAGRFIVYRNGCYQLDSEFVATDIDLLEDPEWTPSGPGEAQRADAPRWWLEPLAGLPWELFAGHRARLDMAALNVGHHWLDSYGDAADPQVVLDLFDGLAARHPEDQLIAAAMTRSRPARAIGATEEAHVAGRHRVRSAESGALPALHLAAEAFLSGDAFGAQELVQMHADRLGPDLTHRAERWFSVLDPAEGLPNLLLEDLVAQGVLEGGDVERLIVSIDAGALIRMPGGLTVARAECAQAGDEADRLRSQRVLVFLLLVFPLSERFEEETNKLAEFDAPEAAVEAARFRLCAALRRGDFEAVPDLLADVDRHWATLYPHERPWFSDTVRSVLYDHAPTRHLVGEVAPSTRFFANSVERSVVTLSRVWGQLTERRVTPATARGVQQLCSQISFAGAAAIEIMYRLALGEETVAADLLEPYRGRLLSVPREGHSDLLTAAAAEVAMAQRDTSLAAEVIEVLAPMAGEYLGVWICDVLIEPVDTLRDRLRRMLEA
ncbi:MAG: helix-turn-helix domain-containing protein [Actinomycetota bacterium]